MSILWLISARKNFEEKDFLSSISPELQASFESKNAGGQGLEFEPGSYEESYYNTAHDTYNLAKTPLPVSLAFLIDRFQLAN